MSTPTRSDVAKAQAAGGPYADLYAELLDAEGIVPVPDPDTVNVRVSVTVYLDLDSRDMAVEYGVEHAGDNLLTVAQATSLLDDAMYQSDPADAGYGNTVGKRNAYKALAKNIRKELSK